MPLTKPGASEMNNPSRDNSSEPGYAAAIAAAPLGEPRWWRPQHAVHRYVGIGTYRAACVSAASGGMMCPSYPATRHDSTCEHISPDHLYVGSHAG
jgi:hypothetical protein